MTRSRMGFTMLELLVAMALGAILMALAVKAFGSAQNAASARSARDAYVNLHARARAHAIERGTVTRLRLEPATNRAWVIAGNDTIERMDFHGRYGASVRSLTGTFDVCMTARGYAEDFGSGCLTSVEKVAFQQGNRTQSVDVLPLGQLAY